MISYAGPDCLVSMVVLHFCGQLTIIRRSLKNLVDGVTKSDPKKYWKKIAAIVTRHEQINDLAIVIRMTFSSILLVQMLACSLTFCFQAYTMFTTLMDRDGGETLPLFELGFSMIYAVYTVIHLFIYCYVGDRLSVESTSLADDFYETEWYTLSSKEAKAFLLICQRSRVPLEIKAGKFCTFNLQLFNAILKNSMGYLSMLIAMKQRLIE
uniref:Odorant receptor n=1 Tax=Campoletis chlorideae TaxID=219166 RepID=A0A346D488_9HYME|nr:odorant receptor [Campoletis chlorideae]